MRRLVVLAVVVIASRAQADVFTGEVVAARGAWEGDAIVTTATLRTPIGDVEVQQLGGYADGYGMVVFDGEVPLEPGRRVAITARADAGTWMAQRVTELGGGGGLPYVPTLTKRSRVPLRWAASCVQVGYAADGTTAIAGEGERAVVEAAFAHWNDSIAGCSSQNFASLGPIDREVSGRDFVTVIKFRDDEWCRPAVDGKPRLCHSPSAAGITTVVFVDEPGDDRDGEIVDADIELNGVDFAISVDGVTESLAGCDSDLANTLTHELGHVLGLEHACRTPTDDPRLDAAGAPVPLCSATTDPVITEATMYPFQSCGETKKASLSTDEVAAMCETYPATAGSGVCKGPAPLDSGCCSSGPAPPSLGLGLATLALLRRRRAAAR